MNLYERNQKQRTFFNEKIDLMMMYIVHIWKLKKH